MANPFSAKAKKKDNPWTTKKQSKEPEKPASPFLAKKRAKDAIRYAESDTRDRVIQGIKIHTVREHDGYWSIDVTNGDVTVTFHNKHGAWFMNMNGQAGHMREPAMWLSPLLQDRWLEELKRQGKMRGYLNRNEAESKKKKADKKVKEESTSLTTTEKKHNPFTSKKGKRSRSQRQGQGQKKRETTKSKPHAQTQKTQAKPRKGTGRARRIRRRS